MIRHNDIMVDENIIIFVIHQMYVFFDHVSICGERYHRYVASAVPYNFTKRLLSVFGTDGNEIDTIL